MKWDKGFCTYTLVMPPGSKDVSNFASWFESAFDDFAGGRSAPRREAAELAATPRDLPAAAATQRAAVSVRFLDADVLPSVDTLPRPEILFATTAPYHLVILLHNLDIEILSSHHDSLQVIKEYFSRHMRQHHEYTAVRCPGRLVHVCKTC